MKIIIGDQVILSNDSHNSTVTINNCSQVEVFDLVNSHCTPICPDRWTLQQGICVTMISDAESILYPGYYEINLIGGSISIVSSLAILLTYALFKQLRNFHSLLLVNLTLAFLINDSFIVVGVTSSFIGESHGYCIATAICLHFFFLVRFLWTNILGIEYCRVFRLAFRVQNEVSKRTHVYIFILYALIGWGIPLAIVTVSVVLNFTTELVRYGIDEDGSESACWINDSIYSFFAFLIPITISGAINLVIFIVVMVLIYLSSRHSKAICSSKKTKNFKNWQQLRLIIAIFTVLGLTCIFVGITLSPFDWGLYPFLVLNYLQPLIIAVAFLWSKRVGLLYVGLFKKAIKKSVHRLHVDLKKSSKLESNVTQTAELFDENGALHLSGWIIYKNTNNCV